MPCIVARDNLGHEVSPAVQLIEVMTATQQQGLLQAGLEMSVPALDRPVFVCNAAIVPGRFHALVGTQRVIACAQVLSGIPIEIGEGGRQAVRPMFARGAAEKP